LKRKRNSFYLFILIISIVAFFTAGCKVSEKISPLPTGDEPGEYNNTEPEKEPLPRGFPSPYTGTIVDKVFPVPFCVLVENHPSARPQSGLKDAELVYELPVEGGYTRFLAIYASPYEGEIGPVRSSRPYFAHLIKEHNGIMAHCGYSIHTEEVLKSIKLKYLDERFNPQYYRREKSRKMPHNLYTTLEKLWQGAEDKNFLEEEEKTIQPFFTFSDPPDQRQGELAKKIEINFSSTDCAEYHWNAKGGYTRYHNGEPFGDAETKEEIAVSNIIVQFVQTRTLTAEGHLDISLVGEGKGFLFSGATVEEIKWKKESGQGKTIFGGAGGELLLSPGNTWIHLVPQGSKVNWSP
jgi:hypothetical protein